MYYSGTVAAAREAAMCYIPAMAVSIMPGADDAMRNHLADLAVRIAEAFQNIKLPRFGIINLNAPAVSPEKLQGFKLCPISRAYYLDGYEKRVSPLGQTYFWLKASDTSGVPMEQPEEGSDYYWLRRGYVTCTFLGDFTNFNQECGETLNPFLEQPW